MNKYLISFLVLLTSCGSNVVETVESTVTQRIVLTSSKIHTSSGSVFVPEERSFSEEVDLKVPQTLRIVAGAGSNDARAAVIEVESSSGVTECAYSPSSTVNKPLQSGNKGQIKSSFVYHLLDCDSSQYLKATKVSLSLNKGDSSVEVVTILGEIKFQ